MSLLVHFYDIACCSEAEELVLIEGRTQDPSSAVRGEEEEIRNICGCWDEREPQWKASISLEGRGNAEGHQGVLPFKKTEQQWLNKILQSPPNECIFIAHNAQFVCRAELTVSLFWPPPPFSQSLGVYCSHCRSEVKGTQCAICKGFTFQCAICHVAVRGVQHSAWPVDTRGHTSHMMEWPGPRVSHRLWVPLPAWKHFLTHSPRALWEVLEAHRCWLIGCLPEARLQSPPPAGLGCIPLKDWHGVGCS